MVSTRSAARKQPTAEAPEPAKALKAPPKRPTKKKTTSELEPGPELQEQEKPTLVPRPKKAGVTKPAPRTKKSAGEAQKATNESNAVVDAPKKTLREKKAVTAKAEIVPKPEAAAIDPGKSTLQKVTKAVTTALKETAQPSKKSTAKSRSTVKESKKTAVVPSVRRATRATSRTMASESPLKLPPKKPRTLESPLKRAPRKKVNLDNTATVVEDHPFAQSPIYTSTPAPDVEENPFIDHPVYPSPPAPAITATITTVRVFPEELPLANENNSPSCPAPGFETSGEPVEPIVEEHSFIDHSIRSSALASVVENSDVIIEDHSHVRQHSCPGATAPVEDPEKDINGNEEDNVFINHHNHPSNTTPVIEYSKNAVETFEGKRLFVGHPLCASTSVSVCEASEKRLESAVGPSFQALRGITGQNPFINHPTFPSNPASIVQGSENAVEAIAEGSVPVTQDISSMVNVTMPENGKLDMNTLWESDSKTGNSPLCSILPPQQRTLLHSAPATIADFATFPTAFTNLAAAQAPKFVATYPPNPLFPPPVTFSNRSESESAVRPALYSGPDITFPNQLLPESPLKSALRSPIKAKKSPKKKTVTFNADPYSAFEDSLLADGPLSGTIFYLDIKSKGKSENHVFVSLLEELGAQVIRKWEDSDIDPTHVLFKDGTRETLNKVVDTKGLVKCVNVGFALDCEKFVRRMDESDYLVDLSSTVKTPEPSPKKRMYTPVRTPSRFFDVRTPSTILSTPTTPNSSEWDRSINETDDKENVAPSSPVKPLQHSCPPKPQAMHNWLNQSPIKPMSAIRSLAMSARKRKAENIGGITMAPPKKLRFN